MTYYGADVSQLRELAKAVDKAASLLSSRATLLQGQIQAAPWKGADGDRFRQDWAGSHRPGLERVAGSLRENSKILLRNADEQEKASDASSGSTFGSSVQSFVSQAKNWLTEQVEKAAETAAHRKELEESLGTMADASPEEQAAWWASLSPEDRKYLIEGEGEDGYFAEELMAMDGGIPEAVQEQARKHLQEVGKEDIPVYTETGKASIDARVAWIHGGAEVGTKLVENADGSATMKVYGNMGIGVNDTSGTAGVTLNGEASREYTFGSIEEARAALAQMYSDLPPDTVEEIKDVAGNPPGYILDTINDAADDNGSTGQTDKAKGTLSLEAEGESGPAEGSAKLDLAYERNLTDGTATATAEVSAQGKLDLNGQVFEASGKGGLEVNLDKGNNIDSVSISMEGTVAQGASAGGDVQVAEVKSTVTAGTQGTVKINVDYAENKAVIDSYLRNVASGDHVAAASDAAKLYEAGSATVQVNSVVTMSNHADFDVKVGEVEVKTENQAITNVSTYYKVPNDTKLERL